MAELDIMTDHFPISEEEIMRAIETGQSEKYILRSVGRGGNFRGYVIYDSKYQVRIADYIYNHSQKKFELKMKPNYEEELAKAAREARVQKREEKKVQKYKLTRKRIAYGLGAGAMAAIMFFAGVKSEEALVNQELNDPKPVAPIVTMQSNLENCDYRLCVRYLDYSLSYIDGLISNPNTNQYAVEMLIRVREDLRTNYANRAYAAAADIEDYYSMGGFEDAAQKAEFNVRKYTQDFEERLLTMVSGAKSFAESPLNGALVVDSKNAEGKDVTVVYIAESVENYADGKVPEGAITRDGLLYVPLRDSARYDGQKVMQ